MPSPTVTGHVAHYPVDGPGAMLQCQVEVEDGLFGRHNETSYCHMKFFVPAATDQQEAERVYAKIREFVKKDTGDSLTNRRIASLTFFHEGVSYHAAVGDVFERIGEPVIAIFEGRLIYVCTVNRGALRGGPVLVGIDEVRSLIDFE